MKFIISIIALFLLVLAVNAILNEVQISVGEYFDTTNQIAVRILAQLPTVFNYISIYSIYILFLLWLYVSLDKKCNTFICNLIIKLDVSDNSIEQRYDKMNLLYHILFSLCVVAVRNWPCVCYGYFKYDDFEFFSINRTEPLLSQLVTTHGDHLLPLFRLEVALMHFLFGVTPIYYNLFVSLLFVLILVFAGLLLREMRTSQLTIVLFAICCIGWIDWGEITAGYFCLSPYVQIVLLSIISVWSYFRWKKTSALFYKILVIVCAGSALLLDLSGVWVPLGVFIFSFRGFSKKKTKQYYLDWFQSHQWLLTAIVVLYSAYAMMNWFVFFISKHGTFLSMSGNHSHTLGSFLSQLFYIISGGLLLTPLFPIGFNLLPPTILVPLLAVMFVVAGYILFNAFKNSEGEVKWHILSVLSIIFMTATIVAVGRPMVGFNYALVAKYTGVLYVWFCFLICLVWNHFWQKKELAEKSRMVKITLVLLVFFIGQQTFFDNILFLYQAEATGYKVNLKEAETRKNNINEIRKNLMLPLCSSYRNELHIPSLDGKYIYSAYPKLWKYNLSHYLDFMVPEGKKVVLYKNTVMQAWAAKDVVTVTSLRSNTDSEFIKLLENSSFVQHLYLAPVELTANSVSDTDVNINSNLMTLPGNASALTYQPSGSLQLYSNGKAEITVDKGSWNPEKKHLLVLKVALQGSNTANNVKLDVHFTGKLKIPYNKNIIIVPSNKQSVFIVDLLQLYSYSLNPQVGNLSIGFPTPGNYIVSGLYLI